MRKANFSLPLLGKMLLALVLLFFILLIFTTLVSEETRHVYGLDAVLAKFGLKVGSNETIGQPKDVPPGAWQAYNIIKKAMKQDDSAIDCYISLSHIPTIESGYSVELLDLSSDKLQLAVRQGDNFVDTKKARTVFDKSILKPCVVDARAGSFSRHVSEKIFIQDAARMRAGAVVGDLNRVNGQNLLYKDTAGNLCFIVYDSGYFNTGFKKIDVDYSTKEFKKLLCSGESLPNSFAACSESNCGKCTEEQCNEREQCSWSGEKCRDIGTPEGVFSAFTTISDVFHQIKSQRINDKYRSCYLQYDRLTDIEEEYSIEVRSEVANTRISVQGPSVNNEQLSLVVDNVHPCVINSEKMRHRANPVEEGTVFIEKDSRVTFPGYRPTPYDGVLGMDERFTLEREDGLNFLYIDSEHNACFVLFDDKSDPDYYPFYRTYGFNKKSKWDSYAWYNPLGFFSAWNRAIGAKRPEFDKPSSVFYRPLCNSG